MKKPEVQLITFLKSQLRDKQAKSFSVKMRGQVYDGLVIFWEGKYFAYQNLCKHVPVTLDLRDGKFFNHEKTKLQCHMHGAIYEVETGECTAGPCVGAKLNALAIEEQATRIIVRVVAEVV